MVTAERGPTTSKVFIAGSGDELGNWKPSAVPLRQLPDGSWYHSFQLRAGTEVYFKVTGGNWSTEALDSRDPQIGALQHFIVSSDTEICLHISKWMDRDAGITRLNAKLLSKYDYYGMTNAWRYHIGDNPKWASSDFDDSSWDRVNSLPQNADRPQSGWEALDGSAWISKSIRRSGMSRLRSASVREERRRSTLMEKR